MSESRRAPCLRRPLVAVSLLLAWTSIGQPLPSLSNSQAIYLQQGKAREVAIEGQNLATARSLIVPNARGLSATLAPDKLRVNLSAASDSALGDRELRVVTPTGLTSPLKVTVGQFPVIEEASPNESIEGAQPVELPAEITGHISFPGDADFFRFTARRGQHLLFDVHASRIGSPLEPVVTIHASSGRELPHTIEYHGRDPMLVFDVPSDGSYVLQVRDLQYRGAASFAYRIESGPFPYIESLLPSSGQPGQRIEALAIGHNLKGVEHIQIDLTGAASGIRDIRARSNAGWSNAVPFLVTDLPPAQVRRSTAPATQPITVPSDVSGLLRTTGQEDAYSFHLSSRQQITLAVTARKTGSPLDALLTLKNAAGAIIEQSNGGADSEAKLSRTLEPGEYTATLRDLTYAGGESYSYLLSFTNAATPDYAIRVLPDNPRAARGGYAKLWCDPGRLNGLRGPITLGIAGLPPGVSNDHVVLEDATSGIASLYVSPDAPLGTFPLQIKALSPDGAVRSADPVYLTILASAPVAIESVTSFKPQQWKEYEAETAALSTKLKTSNPKLDAGQAAWEKKLKETAPVEWKVLYLQTIHSSAGATLTKQQDGSILAGGKNPQRDTYTLTAHSDLKGVTAVRLEALSDPSLPSNGPGRAANGNIVVAKFAVNAGPQADPKAAKPLTFKSATATFEQANYPATSAVGLVAGGGWALSPELGKNQTATFVLATPANLEPTTALRFSIEQSYGAQHTLGRFRLSVTSDPRAGTPADKPSPIPPAFMAIIRTPAEKRTPEQKTQLAQYYRSTSPEFAEDYARLSSLRRGVGVYAEIAELNESLTASPPLNPSSSEAVQRRLMELKATATPLPLKVARNADLSLPVPIKRQAGFVGDVTVTLEGFTSGRDSATRAEPPIAPNLAAAPLTLPGFDCFGTLNIRPTPNCELGTRMVILRTETKMGPDTYVAYSDAFPLAVTEK